MTGPVKMLVVFLNEVDRIGDEPLYEVVMRRLRKRDVAGATALHGVMGFGQHHRMHHKGLFGIADEHRVGGSDARAFAQPLKPRRIGLARMRAIAANHRVDLKKGRQLQALENPPRRGERFVRQHGQRRAS